MQVCRLLSLCLVLFLIHPLNADSIEEKIEAYKMVAQVLPQLESQLDKLNKSIEFAEAKIKSSQSEAMKNLFQGELDKMENQKETIESKVGQLTSIIDELKKDSEVGSLIKGEEATRDLKQKLDRASALLPKIE
jgi:predicted  nucleic acid-binding Zn-ribbon protein